MSEFLEIDLDGVEVTVEVNYCPDEHKVWVLGVTLQGVEVESLFKPSEIEKKCLMKIEKIHAEQDEDKAYDSIGDR